MQRSCSNRKLSSDQQHGSGVANNSLEILTKIQLFAALFGAKCAFGGGLVMFHVKRKHRRSRTRRQADGPATRWCAANLLVILATNQSIHKVIHSDIHCAIHTVPPPNWNGFTSWCDGIDAPDDTRSAHGPHSFCSFSGPSTEWLDSGGDALSRSDRQSPEVVALVNGYRWSSDPLCPRERPVQSTTYLHQARRLDLPSGSFLCRPMQIRAYNVHLRIAPRGGEA